MNEQDCGHRTLQPSCKSCISIRAKWYEILQKSGFKDIEGPARLGYPLNDWMKCAPGDIELIELLKNVCSDHVSFFSDNLVGNQERFAHHPDFHEICIEVCKHKNSKVMPHQVKTIWLMFTEQKTNREIGKELGLHHSLVFRTIDSLRQYMNLMDLSEEPKNELLTVVTRDYEETDNPFIYSTWRNALWYDHESSSKESGDLFFKKATQMIKELLENPQTKCQIACAKTDPTFLVGYSVTTGKVLHFAYVKWDYRKKGVCRILVPTNIKMISPIMTRLGKIIARHKSLDIAKL